MCIQLNFKNRGLPHSFIIIWLNHSTKRQTSEEIDEIISTKIPDPNKEPEGYDVVSKIMMHGSCGLGYQNSPCVIGGKY